MDLPGSGGVTDVTELPKVAEEAAEDALKQEHSTVLLGKKLGKANTERGGEGISAWEEDVQSEMEIHVVPQ